MKMFLRCGRGNYPQSAAHLSRVLYLSVSAESRASLPSSQMPFSFLVFEKNRGNGRRTVGSISLQETKQIAESDTLTLVSSALFISNCAESAQHASPQGVRGCAKK
jgi:hypothetical protein